MITKKQKVSFMRGTAEEFAKLTQKDEDTLYFVTEENGANKIYRGSDLFGTVDYDTLINQPVVITEEEVQNILDKINQKQDILTEQDKKDIANLAGVLGYITEDEVVQQYLKKTDISSWAKQPQKPTYTAEEVGALSNKTYIPDISGLISEETADTKYQPKGNYIIEETDPTVPSYVKQITETDISKWNKGRQYTGGTGIEVSEGDIISVNDKVLLVEAIADWAKQPQKPTYTAVEVGALPSDTYIPDVPSHVLSITTEDIAKWNQGKVYTGGLGITIEDTVIKIDSDKVLLKDDLGDWAKAAQKPTYTAEEVGAIPASEKDSLATKEDLTKIKHFKVLAELPVTPDPTLIYLIPKESTSETSSTIANVYDEYIWIPKDEDNILQGHWEFLGSTEVNLTDYVTKELLSDTLKDYATTQITDNINSQVEETSSDLQNYITSNNESVADINSKIQNINQTIEQTNSDLANLLTKNKAFVLKGSISDENELPTEYKTGWLYKIEAAGNYKGHECLIGDFLVSVKDNETQTASQDDSWALISGSHQSSFSYEDLTNKPTLNGVEISGAKTTKDYKIANKNVQIGGDEPTDEDTLLWFDESDSGYVVSYKNGDQLVYGDTINDADDTKYGTTEEA